MYEIKDFYDSVVKKRIHRSSMRSFAKNNHPELCKSIEEYWNEEKSVWTQVEEFPPELTKMLINLFTDQYQLFENHLNIISKNFFKDLAANHNINQCDFILLNYIRLIKSSDDVFAKLYIKADPMDLSVGDLSDDWINIEVSELSSTWIPRLIDQLDTLNSGKHNELFYMLACSSFLQSKQLGSVWPLSASANVDWALNKLSNVPGIDPLLSLNDRTLHSNFLLGSMVKQIAGILGGLHKSQSYYNNTPIKFEFDPNHLRACFMNAINVDRYGFLESIWLPVDNAVHKTIFNCKLLGGLEEIEFWMNDNKNKLIYLLAFEVRLNKKKLKQIPSDYFSYSKIISNGNQDNVRYTFPNKRSYKNFLRLPQSICSKLLDQCIDYDNLYRSTSSSTPCYIWTNFTFWLGSINDIATIDPKVINLILSLATKFYKQGRNQGSDIAIAHVLNAFQKDLSNGSDDKPEIENLADYLCGYQFKILPSGKVSKTRTTNSSLITKHLTVKSLISKSNDWHQDLNLFAQSELLKKYDRYSKQTYDRYKSIVLEKSGYSISLITNHYDLLQEGVQMQHCVNTYHERIRNGKYVVFSIKPLEPTINKMRATLGLSVMNIGMVRVDQIKGLKNAHVGKELEFMANTLCLEINQRRIEIFNDEFSAVFTEDDFEF